MSPIIPFPAALNHQSPNLAPHLGWISAGDVTIVMPTHLEEGAFNLVEGGHYALMDGDGEFITEIWVDALPGLDVYAQH